MTIHKDYTLSFSLRKYYDGKGFHFRKLGPGRVALDFGKRAIVIEFISLASKE